MRFGKLNKDELSQCLNKLKPQREETIVGSALGEDCAVLKLVNEDVYMLQSVCIFDELSQINQLVSQLNASFARENIASVAITLTLIAHANESIETIKSIVKTMQICAEGLNIDIVGGHTEFSSSVNKTLVFVTIIGKHNTKESVENLKHLKPSNYSLVTTDPITAVCNEKGFLSINVCANDIYATGGVPNAASIYIVSPIDASDEDVDKIIDEIEDECKRQSITVFEIIEEPSSFVKEFILSTTMIGSTDKPILNDNAQVGDKIIVTKDIGLEGTKILLDYENMEDNFDKYEISIMEEAKILRKIDTVTTMHDITESGVFGAVCEIALCSNKGAKIFEEKIPLREETIRLTKKHNLNPFYLISSGSVLYTINPKDALKSIELLKNINIKASIIGEITKNDIYYVGKDGNKHNISIEADEIFKVGL